MDQEDNVRRQVNQPWKPEKVLAIVRLRDVHNWRWRQIGAHFGETHQGPYLLYKKWREWAYEEKG